MTWLRTYWAALQPVTPVSLGIGLGLPASFLLIVTDQIITHFRQRD